jgi:ubiquinone/menaquinone biosynthesis C-methylase UbiE
MFSVHRGPAGPCVWDRIWKGDRYANQMERVRRARRRLNILGLVREDLPLGSRLLDLGCGSGENLFLLNEMNLPTQLVGVDFSASAVSTATHRLQGRASVCRADARALPFADSIFTHVTAFGILEHVVDAHEAVAELARVASSKAHVYITTSNRWSVLQGLNTVRSVLGRYRYGYQKNWTAEELAMLLEPHFTVEELRILQADWDMPIVKMIDMTVRARLRTQGRYVYARCMRR